MKYENTIRCSRSKRRRRGSAIIETLVAGMCSALIGAGLLGFVQVNFVARGVTMGQHMSDTSSRRPLDNLAACIRKAQFYNANGQCVAAAAPTDLTIYTSSTGTTTRYWLDTTSIPYSIKGSVGSIVTTMATGMDSLQYTYYLPTGKTPSQGSCWQTTVNPSSPTAAELPQIVAVGITIKSTIDGTQRTYTSTVRLRNGPRSVSGF